MHEEALFRDLRRELGAIARRERVERITRVALWVGALSHVSEQTVRDRWAAAVEGTPAEHARLEVVASSDLHDPRAGGILITQVDVPEVSEEPPGGRRPLGVSEGPGHGDRGG
ncbi:MAG TPA: hydrogenase maturation nickel metallochaperone HypA [Thermoplasmata archaeon]|nr:hydrogenase maturation nickel metallochaperone HypA [Thermoplasmata archaeon]